MRCRRYFIELGSGLAAYMILIIITVHTLRAGVANDAWRIVISLLPMLAVGAICWSILRQLRRLDEMQRLVQLEALAVAFAGTAMATLSYGLLENAGFPRLSMFWIWPMMGFLWEAGLLLARRRYR